jgi:signal transduction histidine kinase
VDLVGNNAVSLIKAKLQNKGNRYFFTDSIKLAPGDIFISPLDLNIEGNAIELPHKPMLRFATPVSDAQGAKRGIVIVNYLGRELLRAFANATNDIASHAMLVNGDGYWLKSPVPADEWGFMFKKPELSLAHRSPAAWSQISATDEGQVITADGLWTWQSVYPLIDGMTSSTGAAEAFQSSQGEVKSRQYVWKSVAHRPAEQLQHVAQTIWAQVIGVASVVMGVFAFISLLLARAWQAQARAEKEALRNSASLQVELERSHSLNKQLEQAQNRLLQAEKLASIGQLAAGVAHEINNPIGFVKSNLGTLAVYTQNLLDIAETLNTWLAAGAPQNDTLTGLRDKLAAADLVYLHDDLTALLQESGDGLDRVKKIVADLKGFARVDSTEYANANLNTGLDSAVNMVWHEIKYKADVVRDYGELPALYCNAAKINQVFMNLLVNAGQAIAERGSITLRTRHDGDWVNISVSDNGSGIAPEHLQRIFDPFFTTKPVGKGTGLGLSLAWGIVNDHGGHIEVQSKLGEGTTFSVLLPVNGPNTAPSASV